MSERESADSLIMETAASLSPLFNTVGSCHHDLHDVITFVTLIWATEGFAVGNRGRKEVGDLGDLPAETAAVKP